MKNLAKTKIRDLKVNVNSIQLNVLEIGDGDIKSRQGKLVILLHGFPSYSGNWFRQIDMLTEAGY